eukprot:gene2638-5176_t
MTEEDVVDDNVIKSEISFFVEYSEVIDFIKDLCSERWEETWNLKWEWLFQTIAKYQEQSIILNPYLEEIVTLLTGNMLNIINSLNINNEWQTKKFENSQFSSTCKTLQLFCRVRGFKHVVKHFPHEVNQLEPCMYLLRCQDREDFENWETRYVLLLWLSILCLMPFDICSMDSSMHTTSTTDSLLTALPQSNSKLVSDIVYLCREFLTETGPTRDAASSCLAALLTRPDMVEGVLSEFINWSCNFIELWTIKDDSVHMELSSSSFRLIGILQCLSQIFKKGHRNNLIIHAANVLSPCIRIFTQENQTLIRKLATKLMQRLGMTYLPPKVAQWRYQRGNRSLLLNLQQSHKQEDNNGNNGSTNRTSNNESKISSDGSGVEEMKHEEEEEDDDDIPSDLEEIVGQLLQCLRDKDTVVRWSAAKGVGRVGMRLPKTFVDDIVGAILEMFLDADADAAWHGGCLGLAELCRRGLLLPERLTDVVPLVAKAIHFDVLRGQHSIGAHVRDAACYVCWAFARAYSPVVMRPFVRDLSQSMLLTSLFDREVNCRRAASAAFQENVGRQGHENFPLGIDTIAIADFFSLSSRSNAYVKVAPAVAALDDQIHVYLEEHLRVCKLSHWDEDIRTLSAKALGKLAYLNPTRLLTGLLSLASDVLHPDPIRRHGILLGISEILLALRVHTNTATIAGVSSESVVDVILPDSLVEELVQTVPKMDKARMFRGKGGEILRRASCYLVECIARSHLNIPIKTKISLIEFINENLKQPHEKIQLAAASALRHSLYDFFTLSTTKTNTSTSTTSTTTNTSTTSTLDRVLKITVEQYIEWIRKAENVALTRGGTLALGVLPLKLLCNESYQSNGNGGGASNNNIGLERLALIITTLDNCSKSEAMVAGDHDAETRRNAMTALTEIGIRLSLLLSSSSSSNDKNINGNGNGNEVTEGSPPSTTPSPSPLFWIRHIFTLLLRACEDYSVDKRGDIGSWVRTAGLRGLVQLTLACLRVPRAGDAYSEWPLSFENATSFTRFGMQSFVVKDGDSMSTASTIASTAVVSKGWHVETSFGIGVVHAVSASGTVLLVRFPPENTVTSALEKSESQSTGAGTGTGTGAGTDSNGDVQDIGDMVVLAVRRDAVRPIEPPVPPADTPFQMVEYSHRIPLPFPPTPPVKSDSSSSEDIAATPAATTISMATTTTGHWINIFDQELCTSIICVFLKQVAEKLDWVRGEAGSGLSRLVLSKDPSLPCLQGRKVLEQFVQQPVNWSNPSEVFHRLLQILHPSLLLSSIEPQSTSGNSEYSSYFYAIISGLVISVGGLTESVVKESSSALIQWCKERSSRRDIRSLSALAKALLKLLNTHSGDDRIIFPTFRLIAVLLRNDSLNALFLVESDGIKEQQEATSTTTAAVVMPFCIDLLVCIQKETSCCNDVTKLYTCVDLLVLTIGGGGLARYPAFRALIALIGHKYPKVRRYAAEQLYLQLLSDPMVLITDNTSVAQSTSTSTASCLPGSPSPFPHVLCGLVPGKAALEEATDLLISTVWDAAMANVRPSLSHLRQLLGVPLIKKVAAVTTEGETGGTDKPKVQQRVAKSAPADELASYESLVRDAGK